MILLFIITSILYLIMIYSVLSLYYKYRKDNFELENRVLQLEKRINNTNKELKGQVERFDDSIEYIYTIIKEEVCDMACGTKGRPRGRHTTSRGGGRKK